MSQQLQTAVDAAWEKRDTINSATKGEVREAVETAIAGLDDGSFRTAEKFGDEWVVHQWLKKAVLLSFRLYDSVPMDGGATFPGMGGAPWFDKVPLKTTGWDAGRFAKAGFRAVPGSVVRRGSYIAPSVVLMPSFVNLGAYVDTNTMVDTWATVGSCAQIGKHCHLSGAVGIGGVLEPLQANPTIIEDNVFVGARSEVAEGVIVGQGSVISMGVYLSSTTPIIDRRTGETITGRVPPYSVIMSGSRPNPVDPSLPSTYCAVIMKTVDERTRSKTSVNELLRE